MPDRIDRLEVVLRRHLLRSLPIGGRALFQGGSASDVHAAFLGWRYRFIRPGKRAVLRAQEMASEPLTAQYDRELRSLEDKIRAGADLSPHLSRAAHFPYRNTRAAGGKLGPSEVDLLLAEWGVHHLHLGENLRADGLVERSRHVVLACFREESAYLIGIYDHPSTDNWAAEEIFARMVRNWPNAGLAHQLQGVLGLSQSRTDEERLQLRNAGINQLIEIDGKVFVPGDIGMTGAGTPIQARHHANSVSWTLREAGESIDETLSSVDGVSNHAYWVPHVHVVEAGFEEYCGFLAGGDFFSIAQII